MNRKIIQKIIDALNVGTPDKVMYAIGALDTLLESLPDEKIMNEALKEFATIGTGRTYVPPKEENMSESEIMDAEARARLNNVDISSIKDA